MNTIVSVSNTLAPVTLAGVHEGQRAHLRVGRLSSSAHRLDVAVQGGHDACARLSRLDANMLLATIECWLLRGDIHSPKRFRANTVVVVSVGGEPCLHIKSDSGETDRVHLTPALAQTLMMTLRSELPTIR